MHTTFDACHYKVRPTYHGCRYQNGGCEQFCRQLPNRSHLCFCANGYRLDRDNSTCVPQGLLISNLTTDLLPCGLLAFNHVTVFLIQLKCPVEDNWYILPQGLSMVKYAPKDTVHGRWETGYVFNTKWAKQHKSLWKTINSFSLSCVMPAQMWELIELYGRWHIENAAFHTGYVKL